MVVTDLQEDKIAALAEEIGASGLSDQGRRDVTDDVDAAVAAAVERFGRLDVLVNNAGGCIVSTVPEDTTDEEWHRQLDLTLVGAARCIQASLPHLVKTRGNVVTISSVNGVAAFGNIEYAAAKAGQIAMSQNFAARYGPLGVRFNVVAPGTVRTPNWDNQPDTLERFKTMYPLGRVGEPEDIAAAVAFLCLRRRRLDHRPHPAGGRRHPDRPRPLRPDHLGPGPQGVLSRGHSHHVMSATWRSTLGLLRITTNCRCGRRRLGSCFWSRCRCGGGRRLLMSGRGLGF